MRKHARRQSLPGAAVILLSLLPMPASAVNMDWVYIGNPGNPADAPSTNCAGASCGSVPYGYYISKYEVTNAQYVEFLNAKGARAFIGLYDESMASDANNGGITRSGSAGNYSYAVKSGFEDKPVTYVSFYDALRFANWLNNGQGSGDTERGAYTLQGGTPTPSNGTTVLRNALATTFLPSENEWYKAAYYSPGGVYFDYPAGTNTPTACAAPGATANTANCLPAVRAVTTVGAYTGSMSPYGTFDQGGNVWEWNEQMMFGGGSRGIRGGAWNDGASFLASSVPGAYGAGGGVAGVGFRVASLVPEPGTGLLVLMGLLGIAARRRRRV